MLNLEWMWQERNRTRVLLVSGATTAGIAVLDWRTEPYVSLGFLYLFPIMLAAGFLPRWVLGLLGVAGAILSALFSSLAISFVRLVLEAMALSGCGLFVGELIRNRRLSLEAQDKLRILVETSPAAIVTVDEQGCIELGNRAATELLLPVDGQLVGSPIAAFLPDLHHALRREEGPQFRSSMQCVARRGNGEIFTADVWFSTFKAGIKPTLAAIIADVSEDTAIAAPSSVSDDAGRNGLSVRETEVLRFVVQGLTNKEIATQLALSESTVKNAIQQLFARTGVRTRSQLVRVALEQYRHLL
jgi:two-component system sensor kinase FixL